MKMNDVSSVTNTPDKDRQTRGITAKGLAEYETAFELTGNGKFNYMVLVTCSLIFSYACIETLAVGYIMVPAECDIALDMVDKGLISSASFFGVCSGALCWGMLSDMYGRRKVMIPTMVGSLLMSVTSSLVDVWWEMFVLRLLTGIFVAAPSAIILVYLGEMDNYKQRAQALVICMSTGQVSFVIIPALAWAIIPATWSFTLFHLDVHPWRLFMWLWAVVGIAGLIMLIHLPESPRFLLAAEGVPATLPILRRIYAVNFHRDPASFPVEDLETHTHTLHSGQAGFEHVIQDFRQLFKPPMKRCLSICCGGMATVFFLERGLYIWLPDFLNVAIQNAKTTMNICGITDKYLDIPESNSANEECTDAKINMYLYPVTIAIELLFLLPFIAIMLLINKFSRVEMYAATMCICAAGQLLALVPFALFAITFLIVGVACGACACLLQIMAAEAFPTSLRGLAVSIMYTAGQVGAILGTASVGMMYGLVCYMTILLIAAMSILSAVILYKMWPKSLDDIRKQMEARDFTY